MVAYFSIVTRMCHAAIIGALYSLEWYWYSDWQALQVINLFIC